MNRFATRVRWLGITTAEAARIVRVPVATAEAWRAGRYPAPRPVLRLLAVWGRARAAERHARFAALRNPLGGTMNAKECCLYDYGFRLVRGSWRLKYDGALCPEEESVNRRGGVDHGRNADPILRDLVREVRETVDAYQVDERGPEIRRLADWLTRAESALAA